MLGSRNGSGRANDYCLCFRLICFISFFIVSYLYTKTVPNFRLECAAGFEPAVLGLRPSMLTTSPRALVSGTPGRIRTPTETSVVFCALHYTTRASLCGPDANRTRVTGIGILRFSAKLRDHPLWSPRPVSNQRLYHTTVVYLAINTTGAFIPC